jgi:ABC-type multidrug transport system fused ATPase/permease subunit
MLVKSVSIWPNFRDVTAEKVGTVVAIVGATGAGKGTKPG